MVYLVKNPDITKDNKYGHCNKFTGPDIKSYLVDLYFSRLAELVHWWLIVIVTTKLQTTTKQ